MFGIQTESPEQSTFKMSGLNCPSLVKVFAVVLCFLACSAILWQGASSELRLTQETGRGRPARLGDEIVYKCTVTSSALLRWVVEPLIPKFDPLKFWPHDKTQESEKIRGNVKATLIECVQASDGSYNMTSLLTITVASEFKEVKPIKCRSTLRDYDHNDSEGEVVIGFDSKELTISESQNIIAVLRIINGSIDTGDSKAVEVTGQSDTALGDGIDFDFTQSNYTFTNTKTVHYVSVTIVEDNLNEQIETFQLIASSSDAGVTIDPYRMDIRIINHEHIPKDTDECSTNNGGCGHICTDTEGPLRCSCESGYTIAIDGKRCNNIDECGTNNGDCSHTCTDTEGSFICSCRSGYTLAIDERSCKYINESDTKNGSDSHICTDTEESFECSCRDKGESMTPLVVVITILLGATIIGMIIITRDLTLESTMAVTWTKLVNTKVTIEMNMWTIVVFETLLIVLGPSFIRIVTEREVSIWITNGAVVVITLTAYAATVLRGSPPTHPVKPDQLRVDDIQTDQVYISWVLIHSTPEKAADQLILVIMRHHDDIEIESRTVTLPGAATGHTAQGLTPGVHYKVKLTAQSSGGEETVGPVEFSTKSQPSPLPAMPDGLTVDEIQTDQVRISWVLSYKTPEEAADRLILVINRTHDSETVESRTVTLPGTATSHTAQGLTPGVHYRVNLTAQNSGGENAVRPVEFSTKKPPPTPSTPPPVLPAKHYGLRVDDIQTDRACVSWDNNTPDGDQFILVVNRSKEVEKCTLLGTATSHTLMDLTPGDHYEVTLTAENLAEDQTDREEYIEQVQFSTLELLPPHLEEVTFTVNWKHRAFVWPEKGIAITLNFDSRLSCLLQFTNTYNFKVTIRAYLPNFQQCFPQAAETASVLYNVIIHNPDGMPGKYTPGGMPTLEANILHCSPKRSAYCVFEGAESGTGIPTYLKKHSQSNSCQIEDKEARISLESPCSWFALAGNQNSCGCEFSIQIFVCPDGPQKFHIFFTVTKDLPLLLNALDDMFSEQYGATKVMELPVSFNAEKMSLIVPKDGIKSNGWHITCPDGLLEILRTSASLMPALEKVPMIKLTAKYESVEDAQPFHYHVQFSGLTSHLISDPFFIHCTSTKTDSTAKCPSTSGYDERKRPTLKNLKGSGLLQDLSPYWPLVAISLGLGGSICKIRAMYPGNSPNADNVNELCTLEVIARWLREANQPSWGKMMELIDKCSQCAIRSDIASLKNTMKSKTENLRAPPVNTTTKPATAVVTDSDLVTAEGAVSREDLDWQLLAVALGMGHYISHEQALIQPRPCYNSNIMQLLQLWCRDKGDGATWKELCSTLSIYGSDILI